MPGSRPTMLLDTIEIDEEALRDAYDERVDEYEQPERRLVERLVFPDEAAAEAGRSRARGGRNGPSRRWSPIAGSTLADIDLGDVTRG